MVYSQEPECVVCSIGGSCSNVVLVKVGPSEVWCTSGGDANDILRCIELAVLSVCQWWW